MDGVYHLYVYPNSGIILEMVDSGEVIIAFDETIVKLFEEVFSFTVLGIFMYLCAALGIIKLIRALGIIKLIRKEAF